jgi:hypothetical protein
MRHMSEKKPHDSIEWFVVGESENIDSFFVINI